MKNCSFRRNNCPCWTFCTLKFFLLAVCTIPTFSASVLEQLPQIQVELLSMQMPQERDTLWQSACERFYLLILNQQAPKKKKNSKRKQTLKESSSSQSVTEETKCFIYNSQLENQDVYYRGVNKGLVIPSCQCLRHLNMVVVCIVLIITVSYKTQQTCLRMSAMASGIENKANLPDNRFYNDSESVTSGEQTNKFRQWSLS